VDNSELDLTRWFGLDYTGLFAVIGRGTFWTGLNWTEVVGPQMGWTVGWGDKD
jgi:hypothetical protein